MNPTFALFALAALFVAVQVVLYHPKRNTILEVAVGAGAALDFAQIANVHAFTFAAAAWFIASSRGRTIVLSGWSYAIGIAGLLLAFTAVIGDLVLAKTLALQFTAFVGTAIAIGARADQAAIRNMLRGFLAVVLFSALFAIGQKGGVLPLREFIAQDGEGRVMGIYREPDWLGVYCAAGIVVALSVEMRRRWVKVAIICVLATAMVLTLARAQYLGLTAVVVAVAVDAIVRGRYKPARDNRGVLLTVVVFGAVALTFAPQTRTDLLDRAETAIGVKQDLGAKARVNQTAGLRELAESAPWYGHGLSAAGRIDVHGKLVATSANTVATNWVLGWWVDAALLSIPIVLCLCALALASIPSPGGRLLVLILTTSLVSNTVMFPITWFAVGVALAYWRPSVVAARRARPAYIAAPSNQLAPQTATR